VFENLSTLLLLLLRTVKAWRSVDGRAALTSFC
jgi:hypothetical protein